MTERDLEKIQRDIQRRTRTPLNKADIGVRVGRVLFHYKMGKHFALKIEDGALSWERRKDQIESGSGPGRILCDSYQRAGRPALC